MNILSRLYQFLFHFSEGKYDARLVGRVLCTHVDFDYLFLFHFSEIWSLLVGKVSCNVDFDYL